MQKSILDAIREGSWNFEPDEVSTNSYDATTALPGSEEKLRILADRAEQGLPLWHDRDRRDYEEHNDAAQAEPADRRTSGLVGASPRG